MLPSLLELYTHASAVVPLLPMLFLAALICSLGFHAIACRISASTPMADVLRKATIVLWDEAPSSHKHHVAVADRILRDVMRSVNPALQHVPFGGKVFGLCGDFRQTLPVVKHGAQADVVAACINAASFWPYLSRFDLHQYMRVLSLQGEHAEEQLSFAQFCLDVVEDKIPSVVEGSRRMIEIPASMLSESTSVEELLYEAYGRDESLYQDRDFMTSRSVVSPYNADVDDFNSAALQLFPGQVSHMLCVCISSVCS